MNLPFTILLGAVAAYWIIGLIGLVDLDALEGIGLGESDALDSGGSEEGGSSAPGSFFHGIMQFIGGSDAPLIFVISLFSVFLWGLNVAGNHYFNPGFDGGRATLLLIPVVIGAFVFTRLLVIPLRPVMKIIRSSEKPAEIIGASGRVRSSTLDSEFGEVEVETSEKNLILRARTSSKGISLNKGDRILVVSKSDDDIYLVRPL
ncbi:MAG: hypothetical protein AAGF67_05200 [Verrucomicrobiota bacterium]